MKPRNRKGFGAFRFTRAAQAERFHFSPNARSAFFHTGAACFHPFAGRELSVFPGERGISELCTKGKRNPAAGRPDEIHAIGVDDICA